MNKQIKRLISIILMLSLMPVSAFAVYPTCISGDNIIISDDMQSYEPDAGINSDDGFVSASSIEATFADDSIAALKDSNNIAAKINYGKNVTSSDGTEFAKRVVYNNSTAFVSLDNANIDSGKNLIVKSDLYIPSSTLETLNNAEIRVGVVLEASQRPVGPHGYIYKNADGNLVIKIGPGQQPSTKNITEYEIPTDEWFEITTKLYFEEWTTGSVVYAEMFLNGEPLTHDNTSKLKCVGYFAKTNKFGGYALKLVGKTAQSTQDTIVYVDNINVWQMEESLSIECSIQNGDRNVSTEDIKLIFNDKVTKKDVENSLVIYDEEQKKVTNCDINIVFSDMYTALLDIGGLIGNKQYSFALEGLTSASGRKPVSDFKVSFKTKKGDGIYTDVENEEFSMSFGEATSITQADAAQIVLPLINSDGNDHAGYAIAAAFDENDNLISFSKSDFELTSKQTNCNIMLEDLGAKASYIKIFVLDKKSDGNFNLIHDPDVFFKIDQVSSEATVFPKWPDIDVSVDDAVKSTLKISGKVSDGDTSKFAVAVISKEDVDTKISEILNSKIIAISYDAVNSDGGYAIGNIGFKMPKNTYYAYVITENGISKKEFNYVSIEEAVDVIKDIAQNKVIKEEICDKIKEYNDAFGIDFANEFQTKRDIDILNETVDKKRNTLSGPDNEDYIKQLMKIVNNTIDEIKFLNELENSDWPQIISCLKNNVKYSGIDVLKLDKLDIIELEKLSEIFYSAEFLNSLAVKELYDTTIDEIILQRDKNKDIDAKNELKMIAGDNIIFCENMQGNAHDSTPSAEQNFFVTANVSSLYKNDETASKKGITNTAICVNFGKKSSTTDYEFSRRCTNKNSLVSFAQAGIDTNRDVYVQANVYIPKETVDNLGNGQIRLGALLNSSERPLAPNGYIYKNGSGKLVMAIGPGQQPSTTNITEHEIPVDEWFTLTYKLYFEEWKSGSVVNGEVILNGTPLMHNGGSKLKCYGYFDKSNTFGGFSLRLSGKNETTSNDAKVYIDDVAIWQRKLDVTSSIADQDKYVSTDNINFAFNDAVNKDKLEKAISVIDKDGKVCSEAKIKIDQKDLYNVILSIDGLKKYENYTLKISNLISNNGRKANDIIDIRFLTKKSDSLYSDTFDSDFKISYGTASSIESADVVNVTIPLINPDGKTYNGNIILAAYDANDKLVAKNVKSYTISVFKQCSNISLSGLDSKASSIKIMTLNEKGLIHCADEFPQKEKSVSQEKEYPLWPQFEVRLSDTVSSKIKAYTKVKTSLGADDVMFVITKDNLDISSVTTQLCIQNALGICVAQVNADGSLFFDDIGFSDMKSDTYYAYMIAGNNIIKKEVKYDNIDDVVNVIKSIKLMKESDIYPSLSQVKGGLDSGIDITKIFTTKRDINILNNEIYQKKDSLIGPENADYIDQLKNIIDFAKGEANFLNEMALVDYWSGVLPFLKENKVYTNIDFTKADSLNSDEQHILADALMKKEFENGESVKTFIDSKINDIIYSRNSGSKGSGGGGSSLASRVIIPQIMGNDQTATETVMGFVDMANYKWAENAVANLVKNGVVNGIDSKHFAPEKPVTREEFVKLTVCALGIFEEINETCNFSDVKENNWFYPYVSFAAKNSIVSGISENVFGTGLNISRQDMIVMIYNALLKSGKNFNATKDDFSDFDAISDYAKTAVSALAGDGVVSGRGDNMFAPSQIATRAEAAVFINNVIEKYMN